MPPVTASAPSERTSISTHRMPGSCRPARSHRRRAPPRRSTRHRAGAPGGRRGSCSRRAPSARRSPRRSARRGSSRRRRGGRGRPRRPASSCACAICPTVGNSYSEITMRFRSPRRSSADTSPLTPCDTEVVTATSSASAWSTRPIALRNASFRPTQKSHSAPFSSQPASQPLDRVPDPVREGALGAGVEVRGRLEDRELAADRGADLARRERRAHAAIVATCTFSHSTGGARYPATCPTRGRTRPRGGRRRRRGQRVVGRHGGGRVP